MPRQDIPHQIYQSPTYTESYTLTRIEVKNLSYNLIINYFHYSITSFHLLLSASYVPTT
jgi:hypothetical protein